MMTCSQSAAVQAEAEDANNSNQTQEEPSQEDQTQQPLNPSPSPYHHTPIQTPPHHSAAILQQAPNFFSPQAYSPSVPCAPPLIPRPE